MVKEVMMLRLYDFDSVQRLLSYIHCGILGIGGTDCYAEIADEGLYWRIHYTLLLERTVLIWSYTSQKGCQLQHCLALNVWISREAQWQ